MLKVKGNGKAREFVVTREKIAATILGTVRNGEKRGISQLTFAYLPSSDYANHACRESLYSQMHI